MEQNKKTILIIDDDEMILKSLSTILTNSGFNVLTTTDGDSGLVEALNKEPDLIITDIEMKKVDGMIVLKEIRKANSWGAIVPVIILTNYDANEQIMKGVMDFNPSFYMIKSKIDPQLVVEKINELLSIKK